MSLNVVIIAVIAIIVLVVLIIIFSGKTKVFSTATSDCVSRGGECKSETKCPDTHAPMFGARCEEGQICCQRMEDEPTTGGTA